MIRPERMKQRLHRWLDFYYSRYVGILERVEVYVKTRQTDPAFLTLEEVKAGKKSDVLFLLGCGPSINEMTEREWDVVRRHDSLGVNWFIVHPFVPTYFHTEVNKDPHFRQYYIDAVQRRREDYSRTIFFVHQKLRRRGLHPRFMPGLFPKNPTVCYFKLPHVIDVPAERPFRPSDFKTSIIYRGTMNNAVHLAIGLGYKNIVLLGMDLKTNEYFYDHYDCMRWMREVRGAHISIEERRRHPYGMDHIPEIGKSKHSMVSLYHALDDFVLKPRGIRLYVGSPVSLLYPRVPLYPWPA